MIIKNELGAQIVFNVTSKRETRTEMCVRVSSKVSVHFKVFL